MPVGPRRVVWLTVRGPQPACLMIASRLGRRLPTIAQSRRAAEVYALAGGVLPGSEPPEGLDTRA